MHRLQNRLHFVFSCSQFVKKFVQKQSCFFGALSEFHGSIPCAPMIVQGKAASAHAASWHLDRHFVPFLSRLFPFAEVPGGSVFRA